MYLVVLIIIIQVLLSMVPLKTIGAVLWLMVIAMQASLMGPCEASGEATERIRNYIDKTKTKLDLVIVKK